MHACAPRATSTHMHALLHAGVKTGEAAAVSVFKSVRKETKRKSKYRRSWALEEVVCLEQDTLLQKVASFWENVCVQHTVCRSTDRICSARGGYLRSEVNPTSRTAAVAAFLHVFPEVKREAGSLHNIYRACITHR